MKLLAVIEPGQAPSTRLRLRDCIGRYSQSGIETTVISARRSSLKERSKLIREAARHDVVILFKTTGFTPLELTLLQRANPRILFDFDDAVMFRGQKHRQPLRGKDFKKFVRTLKRCAAAVAGNHFLAGFVEACGVRVDTLPTAIDLAKYDVKHTGSDTGLTIGWVGLSDGLAYLREIQPALRRLSEIFPGLKLKVVSDKPLQLEGVTVENHAWQQETEQTELASFDIGIMPLWDSVWTRGKCGYKILQYMAAGVPVVASAVGANNDIIDHGVNGFLARTQDDWVEKIALLLKDRPLRDAFSSRGRELVEKKYSLDQFAERYIRLLGEVAAPKN